MASREASSYGTTSDCVYIGTEPAEDLSASFYFSFEAASSISQLFLSFLGGLDDKRGITNLLLLFPARLLSAVTSCSGLMKCGP